MPRGATNSRTASRLGMVGGALPLLILLGCQQPDDRFSRSRPEGPIPLNEAVEWTTRFPLEENERVINVITYATVDHSGGYLVADMREAQIRHYSETGALVSAFSRRGAGPGEFNAPVHASRLPSGEILALDMHHTGALFTSSGSAVVRSYRTPVGPLFQAVHLDSLVLLAGRIADDQSATPGARLHVWNPKTDSVITSFFFPRVEGPAQEAASLLAGFVSADVNNDEIAAIFSLSDSVYIFGREGQRKRTLHIPATRFRRLRPNAAIPEPSEGIGSLREWVGSFSLMSHVYWLDDTTLVIQYQDRVGTESHWRILVMTIDGELVFESVDTPHLKTVDRRTRELIFVDPEAEAPNVWARARLLQ